MGWLVGGYSTAVAVLCEKGILPGDGRKLVLRGFSVAVGSSVASTTPITLLQGISSAGTLSSTPIGIVSNIGGWSANGISLAGGYFAISAPTTSVNGNAATMWGDYR